ncbi:hypothetical protein GGI00_006218, partial [Coemansia sp. RSA 2681]
DSLVPGISGDEDSNSSFNSPTPSEGKPFDPTAELHGIRQVMDRDFATVDSVTALGDEVAVLREEMATRSNEQAKTLDMILQLLQAKVSPEAAIVQGGAKAGMVSTPVLASATSGTAMGVESSSHTNPTPVRAVGEEHSAKLPEPMDALSASGKRFGASFSKLPRRELHEATKGLVQTAKVKGMDLSRDEAMDNDPEMAIYGAFAAEAKFAIDSDDDDDESVATSSPFSRSARESATTAERYTEEELEELFYATFVLDKRFPPLIGTLPTYGIGGSNEKDMPALLMAVQRIMCASSLNPNEHGARLLLATLGAGFANLFERRMMRHLRKGKPTTWK